MLCSLYSVHIPSSPISSWTPQVPYLYMQVSQCVYRELYLTPTYNSILCELYQPFHKPWTLNPLNANNLFCVESRIIICPCFYLQSNFPSFFPYSPNIESVKTCANFSSVIREHLTELIKRNTNAQSQIRKNDHHQHQIRNTFEALQNNFQDPFLESLQ